MRSLPIFPSPRPGDAPGPSSTLGHLLLFGFALIGFCMLLRGSFSNRQDLVCEPSWRSRKLLESFLERKDELDVVFVGSSRFMRGIDPAAFDAMTAQTGAPTRSFNYAINGMRMQEIMARVDWILEQKPAKLRHLLVELTTLDPVYRAGNRKGRRMIEWHTGRASLACLEVIQGSDRDTLTGLTDAGSHVAEFGLRLGNIGLASLVLENALRPEPKRPSQQEFNGYATKAEVDARVNAIKAPKRSGASSKPKPNPKQAAANKAAKGRDDLPLAQEAVLREFIARVEASGVELLFVSTPAPRFANTPGFQPDRTSEMALGKQVIGQAFRYRDRRRFAPLYESVNFVDAQHLSPAGADVFSKRLALDFAAQSKASGGDG